MACNFTTDGVTWDVARGDSFAKFSMHNHLQVCTSCNRMTSLLIDWQDKVRCSDCDAKVREAN